MSTLGDALAALRELLQLREDLRRATESLQRVATELRDHDRRLTRLEAQWETALALSSVRLR
jgi:chromosome segregation ATPase